MPGLTGDEISAKVLGLAMPLLEKAGIELVEFKVGAYRDEVRLLFIADRPAGGITIEECTALNRSIVEAIDLDGFLGDNYSLEFSSPGLDRPLASAADFRRNMDCEVRFHLKEPIEGKKEWVGIISEVGGSSVGVFTKQKKELSIPFNVINKAVLVI